MSASPQTLIAKIFTPLLGLVFILICTALYYVFMIVPNERMMGAVQRIFYFHVSSAVTCYVAIVSMFVSGIIVIWKPAQRHWADALNEAAAEVALVFATIVLCTGMIWGNAAWNTPFQWEPRLVSFMILWMLLLGINLLRWFSANVGISSQVAVLSILATLTIPLVIFSVNLLPQSSQLHPQVLANDGLKHPSFKSAFNITLVALISLQAILVLVRYRIALLQRALKEI